MLAAVEDEPRQGGGAGRDHRLADDGEGFLAHLVAGLQEVRAVEPDPADVRGRVFGVLASIVSAASLIPSLTAGPVADRLSTGAAMAIAGVILLVVAFWSIRRRA